MQDSAPESGVRSTEDWRPSSSGAQDESLHISVYDDVLRPQAFKGQRDIAPRDHSAERNDDGVSVLTTDTLSTDTLLPGPGRLSASSPVAQGGDVCENSQHITVNEQVGHDPYFRHWKWEILSMILSCGLVVGIFAVLAKYDGTEQPVWPYNVNINSLISVFTAVITAQLGVIVSGMISQLKWSWFRRPHPLRDLEHYDGASRGIWGSFNFLGRFISQPGAYLAMSASLLFLISAAIGPFTQQSIKTYACQQPLHNISASIPAAAFINSSLDVGAQNPFNRLPNLPMMNAILQGVINTSDNSTQVTFDCPTGNCDFNPYASLAYCSSCEDITSSVRQQYGESVLDPGEFLWNYTLPGQECQLTFRDLGGHPRLGTQGATSSAPRHLITCPSSADFRHKSAIKYTIMSMSWANCTDSSADGDPDNASCVGHPEQLPSLTNTSSLVAMNCTLNLCVRDYIARVRNGLLEEVTTGSLAASSLPNDQGSVFKLLPLPCTLGGQSYDRANLSQVPVIPGRNFTSVVLEDGRNVTAPLECVFAVDESLPWAVNQFLAEQVFSALNGAADSTATCSKNSIGGFTSCDPWYLAPVFNNGRATADSVAAVMGSIAASVSSRMRETGSSAYGNETGDAVGTAISTTVCLRVEWLWLILPVALVLLTMALFAVVLLTARQLFAAEGMPVWKSSAVVPFFHGIVGGAAKKSNGTTVDRCGSLWGLERISAEAAKVAVKLETRAAGQRGFMVVEQEGRSSRSATRHLFFRRSAHDAEGFSLMNQDKVVVEKTPTLPDVELGSQLVSSIRESLRSSHSQ